MSFRSLRNFRRLGYGAVAIGSFFVADNTLNYSTFTRDLRTLVAGAILSVDYKLNFQPGEGRVEGVHQRASKLILDTCLQNGGLFIKFGQQIASLNHVLPPQYVQTFKVLYDEAPHVDYAAVEKIFKEEFNKTPLEMFATFDEVPIASASIAQVHRATLQDGTQLAVKVQKPYIKVQMYWDLQTYKLLVFLFEKLFDIPLYWSADYIIQQVKKEADFINEAANAEKCKAQILQEPRLRERVHVPKAYHDLTSTRVLTAEWIEGVKFGDVARLKSEGYDVEETMTTCVEVFADQIFKSGFVHCDPHVGNMLVRRHPQTKKQQLVLLDHGLYVQAEDVFRHNYCLFWKSLFTGDIPSMERIAQSWGIRDVQMLASSTLQRPWSPGKTIHSGDQRPSAKELFDMQVQAKERVKHFMKDTELLPKELIFIGRNLNLVRSNNKNFGSPVNRVNIMADWAVRGLGDSWSLWDRNMKLSNDNSKALVASRQSNTIGFFVVSRMNYYLFKSSLFVASTVFYFQRWLQFIRGQIWGNPGAGFEDLLDQEMRVALEAQFGIKIDPSAFDA
ncbi:hypothetical protein SmJEL517_g04447 [Synchytrium microbalum]|uniref:ABC1 atypical kinase-like domain-containing protein n=1 Tax=Synchytrium microbalum TaxID=1806994 RepID=A0A507BYB0_9FUNG|nr:uncharacterized protein SmJEL517_g04447 [Synchytrium microbalum]TPX32412.1 hypothetical protein SmJEL517_g04447 [Synchytrium microbalum]